MSETRLMKSERYELTPDEQLVEFWRENPVVAIKDIFGMDLIWLQRIALREMWQKDFAMVVMSRGCSKSTILMLFACLKAMLYPETQIGFVTPAYRQVQKFMFPEIKKLARKSPIFRASLRGNISSSQAQCIAYFNNDSFIEGLPAGITDGATIRGRRYHILLPDEFAQIPEQIIHEVVRPMLNVELNERPNQYHPTSTPFYKWNFMWPEYLHHIKMCLKDPEHYGLVEFDYRDVNDTPLTREMPKLPYKISNKIIEMQKANMTAERFQMENLARFPDETTSYFSSSLIYDASPTENAQNVEFRSEKKCRYSMGIDPAHEADNFSVSIVKEKDGVKRLVRVKTLSKTTYQKAIEMIRELLKTFEIDGINVGAGGGGYTVKDLLAERWVCPRTGATYEPILDREDETHQLMPGRHILNLIDESGPLNEFMYSTLKSDMEHGRFIFPPPLARSEFELQPREKEAMDEIFQTQVELLKLQRRVTERGFKLVVPNPRTDRKDRATSTVLANFWFVEENKTIQDNPIVIPQGVWINSRREF